MKKKKYIFKKDLPKWAIKFYDGYMDKTLIYIEPYSQRTNHYQVEDTGEIVSINPKDLILKS